MNSTQGCTVHFKVISELDTGDSRNEYFNEHKYNE